MSLSYCLWSFRMWLAEKLLRAGSWVEPDYRSRHEYSADGKTITIWREPA